MSRVILRSKKAKTPKKKLPKRRKNICQNAEKIFAKTPKNDIMVTR